MRSINWPDIKAAKGQRYRLYLVLGSQTQDSGTWSPINTFYSLLICLGTPKFFRDAFQYQHRCYYRRHLYGTYCAFPENVAFILKTLPKINGWRLTSYLTFGTDHVIHPSLWLHIPCEGFSRLQWLHETLVHLLLHVAKLRRQWKK